MANSVVVASRRDTIAQRWLKGQSIASIAQETGIPLGTVKHDLHFVRQAMLSGQGDVVRLARSRAMATIELVAAQAWQRVDKLAARTKGNPDDQTILGYLNVVLKTQAQTAKLAGVDGALSDYLAREVVNRDLGEWVDAHDPDEIAHKRLLASIDDEDGEEDEDEADDGSVSEDELIAQVDDAYHKGLEAGAEQAKTAMFATIREMAAQVKAEASAGAPPPASPDEADTPQKGAGDSAPLLPLIPL